MPAEALEALSTRSIEINLPSKLHVDDLAQDHGNISALAMWLPKSYTKPSMYSA